jgi:hypothetical protein
MTCLVKQLGWCLVTRQGLLARHTPCAHEPSTFAHVSLPVLTGPCTKQTNPAVKLLPKNTLLAIMYNPLWHYPRPTTRSKVRINKASQPELKQKHNSLRGRHRRFHSYPTRDAAHRERRGGGPLLLVVFKFDRCAELSVCLCKRGFPPETSAAHLSLGTPPSRYHRFYES